MHCYLCLCSRLDHEVNCYITMRHRITLSKCWHSHNTCKSQYLFSVQSGYKTTRRCGKNLERLKVKIKGKVVPVLFFNWAPRHEGILGEWKYSSTHSLTSALDGGEWSGSRPGHFIPRERDPGTHWIGGWLSPRAVLDAVVKRKIPNPRRESNPTTPIIQPVAQRYSDWALNTFVCDM
jgi:hypothetical protein